jgi:hypothetical protein
MTRTKLRRHAAPENSAAMEPVELSGWERSKISKQEQKLLKNLGLGLKEKSLIFPGDESFPRPPINYRVTFTDHLIRGISTPIHNFLCGLLFIYGIQLHQLTPKSILHIAIFVTLCECFLGTHPNWGLWKRIFYLRRNSSRNIAYIVGGVVICIRPDADYFDVKFPDSVQGWRQRWLYIKDEDVSFQEFNIAPFDGAARIVRRRSWDAEASDEEKKATEALVKRIHELQNTRGKELSGVQITAYFLRIRVQPLQARRNHMWMYAGEEDVDRVSKNLEIKDLEKLIRRFSSLNKNLPAPDACAVEPYSSRHPLPQVSDSFVAFYILSASSINIKSIYVFCRHLCCLYCLSILLITYLVMSIFYLVFSQFFRCVTFSFMSIFFPLTGPPKLLLSSSSSRGRRS